MIFLASSKQSEYDFLEKYIQRKKEENDRKPKNQRSFYCFDHPQWEVLPASKYPSGKNFKIAVGGLTLSDKIVEPDEDTEEYLEELRKAGYTRIIEVPIELYDTAKMGLSKFMMDYAGIASTLSTKFFSYAEYEDNISKVIEPLFSQEILKIGLRDVAKINDSFYPDKIPYSVYSKKLFIHIDTSLSGDRTGISCVAVMGYKDQDRTDENGTSEIMKELIYRHVFTIAIEAPKGDQISFQKTREFIFYLKNVLHWNIAKVTTDGFQSADMRQQLTLAGINTDYVSLDRTPNGYLMFKQALLEKRINLITNEHQKLLYEEFLNVERNNMTGKIDHTIDGCFTADTKIKLVDGRDVTIKELMQEQLYRDNYVYTFNEEKQIIEPKKIKKVFQTKITSDLLRVTLDNGEIIECTPEHRFMLRDGSYKQIQDIKVGDALMPLYIKYPEGRMKDYRMYYEPMEQQWHFEHRKFCDNVVNKKGHVVHHCNYDKKNNRPDNLKCITKTEHMRIHNNSTLDYNKISESVKNWHKRNKGTAEYEDMHRRSRKHFSENYYKRNKEKIDRRNEWIKNHIKEIEETFNVKYDELTTSERNSYGVKLAHIKDPTLSKRQISYKEETHKNLHEIHRTKCWINNGKENKYINKADVIPEGWKRGRIVFDIFGKQEFTEERRKLISNNISKRNKERIWITNGKENKFINKNSEIPEGFYKGRTKKEYKNHKIVKIERIHKPCRVYDLEIEDNHNFALSAGVIVHNSKDALDSLVGATYSASLSITSLDLASMDNFSILMEANKSDYIQDFSGNPVNAMFNMSKTASTASRPVNELSIDEQEQQARQQEQEILRELRSHLDEKDNRQVSNKQLLDMYGNQFEDDDMIIF